MVKKYIRQCDSCKKEIKDLYEFGVTTLYKEIRIGRGKQFKEYNQGNIRNQMEVTEPDDYDDYGKWKSDDENEFTFCSPECLLKFLSSLYVSTLKDSLRLVKKEKEENLDMDYKEFKKKLKSRIPFFQKIQTSFSKKFFKEQAIESANKLSKEIKRIKEEIKNA